MGGIFGSPTPQRVQKDKYLFVDGGYLREVLARFGQTFFGGTAVTVDYEKLGGGYRKCFYYDCVSPQRAQESDGDYQIRIAAERAAFSTIRAVDGWHVTEGVLAGVGGKARQKQVDIQIAVDMLTHSHRRNMEELDFIAGDQDFKPLVDALVRDGMYVKLLYEQTSTSKALVEAADARRVIDVWQVYQWCSHIQKAYTLPHRSSASGGLRDAAGVQHVAHGRTGTFECDLFRTTADYIIVHPDKLNVGNSMHWRHPDQAFLQLVFEHMVGSVEWTPAGRDET